MTRQPNKLLDQVRVCPASVGSAEGMQYGSCTVAGQCKHHAYSTEKTYVYWSKRLILYHDKRQPLEMGEKEIGEFLTYLAVEEYVAALTQNPLH